MVVDSFRADVVNAEVKKLILTYQVSNDELEMMIDSLKWY